MNTDRLHAMTKEQLVRLCDKQRAKLEHVTELLRREQAENYALRQRLANYEHVE